MNYSNCIKYIILLILLTPSALLAGDYFDRHFRLDDSSGSTFEANARYKYLTSSSFFDIEGSQRSKLYETIDEFKDPDEFTFQYSENSIILGLQWRPSSRILLSAALPLTFYSLEEKYYVYYTVVDTATGASWTDRILRELMDYSLTRVEYISLAGRYSIYNHLAKAELGLEFRIPTGFANNIRPTDDKGFLSDGALEIIPGAFFQVDFQTISLQSALKYINRGEELSDAFYFSTSSNLSTIPGTNFIIGLEYFRCLEQYKYAVEFDPQFTSLIEDYLRASLGFGMKFGKKTYFEFNYQVTVFGKNTASIGSGILSANISL